MNLDAIDRALGEKLTPKFLKKHTIGPDLRVKIAREYKDYERVEFNAPEKSANEIFPFVHPRWNIAVELGSSGCDLHFEEILVNIKKLLLYYHKIAINDGFPFICDIYDHGYDYDWDDISRWNIRFDNYLWVFAHLRPLIEKSVVSFVPEVSVFYKARDEAKGLTIDEYKEFKEFCLSIGAKPKPFFPLWVLEIIEQSFWVGSQCKMDLFLPSQEAQSTYKVYVQFLLSKLKKSNSILTEIDCPTTLFSTALPNPEALRIKDIIKMRFNEEGFDKWRVQLRNAITEIDQVEVYNRGVINKRVQEILRIGKMELEQDLKSLSIKQQLYDSFILAGVGYTGVMAAKGIFDWNVLAGVAGASATTFLWKFLKSERERNNTRTLLKHFAVFDHR